MERKTRLARFHHWRLRNIPHRQFVLLLAAGTGLGTGLAAVLLKNLVHFIQAGLSSGIAGEFNYLYFIYPVVGILLTILILRFIIREKIIQGIPAVLHAISSKNSILKRHNVFSSLISSAITVGFGGSVGLEGPTTITGAAIGSNIGKFLRVNYKTITLLLGCGAAGAMAGIFNAPVAAIVFALEVIMLDLTMSSLIPLLVASMTAALTSNLLIGKEILFHMDLEDAFRISDVPYFILLGV